MRNHPSFNFELTTRDWSKRFHHTQREAEKLQKRVQMPSPDTADPEEWDVYEKRIDAIYQEMDKLAEKQAALIAEILESVPREWLIKDAPEEIDWSDPASLDLIQAPKYAELLGTVASGKAFRDQAKN